MKRVCALLLLPVLADAGALYDVAVRPVDDTNMSATGASGSPVVTKYYAEGGNVRVGGPDAKVVYVFKDKTMYVIDNPAHVVHVLKHATLSDVAAHYADAVRQLENAAAAAPPDQRDAAEQKAADMKAVSDRLRQAVAHDFHVTVRFESVDGHACRIWEEREGGVKRLELCVAPVNTVPGGPEILSGMHTLSQFRQGSNFAFGVDFGLSEWWSDFASLGGIPMLVREYKYDSVVSEVMLSSMRSGNASAHVFDAPEGYQLEDGPDYAQWYLR